MNDGKKSATIGKSTNITTKHSFYFVSFQCGLDWRKKKLEIINELNVNARGLCHDNNILACLIHS